MSESNFVKFPSIESFHNVVATVRRYPHLAPEPVNYRPKIKLHGTNAGVTIVDGQVYAQSRNSIITPEKDNCGFAAWVKENESYFKMVGIHLGGKATIFGEWCGKGIQSGTAINKIDGKVFAVFSVAVGESNFTFGSVEVILNFGSIESILKQTPMKPENLKFLGWFGDSIVTVNFKDEANLRATAESLNFLVSQIENCDPWVKQQFGVEGVCEGLVMYPMPGPYTDQMKLFSDLAFKVKGEKHRVAKTKDAASVAPEVVAGTAEFVDMFVTEQRLSQGLSEIGGKAEMPLTGKFLKWVHDDVLKESKLELEQLGATWDQVKKHVQAKAKEWFVQKAKQI